MEMFKRIQDLHREMTDNGLKHLAQMLQRCFDTNTGCPKQTLGNKDQGKLHCQFQVNNSNQNANYLARNSQDTQSVETIYKEAVKRTSSSSEEMDLDLSDEMTDNHESVNQINHSFFTGMDDEQPSTSGYNRGQHVEVKSQAIQSQDISTNR